MHAAKGQAPCGSGEEGADAIMADSAEERVAGGGRERVRPSLPLAIGCSWYFVEAVAAQDAGEGGLWGPIAGNQRSVECAASRSGIQLGSRAHVHAYLIHFYICLQTIHGIKVFLTETN